MIDSVVVGAGLSGLARAEALTREGREVLVLEASDRVGGVVRSERRDGFLLEHGPNTVRPTAELWDLVGRLGLEKDVLLADPRAPRFIDFRGALHPVPTSPSGLFSTRLLSFPGKLRLFAEPFVPRSEAAVESVHSFFARRLGSEVAERFVEPFVSGIYAGNAEQLSMAECFPKLALWEKDHGSLLRGALMGRKNASRRAPIRGLLTFRAGLESLPRAIGARLSGRLRTSARVESLAQSGEAWVVRVAGEGISARHLTLAVPAPEAAKLIESFLPSVSAALREIPHPPLAVLHLAWPTEASTCLPRGFGHLVVPQPGRRILGAVYSSHLFADRAPEGWSLVTVFLGGTRDPDAPSLPDADLASVAERDLRAVFPISFPPCVINVTRYRRALPQYDLAHRSRMRILQEAESSCPGLTFLGNYRGGISVGDVVANASGQWAVPSRGA